MADRAFDWQTLLEFHQMFLVSWKNRLRCQLYRAYQPERGHDAERDEEDAGENEADALEPAGAKLFGQEHGVDYERVPGAEGQGEVVACGCDLKDHPWLVGEPDNDEA